MPAALKDLKVVDLTRTLAGPFCTMMMGRHGRQRGEDRGTIPGG